jgi:hypothetical protein
MILDAGLDLYEITDLKTASFSFITSFFYLLIRFILNVFALQYLQNKNFNKWSQTEFIYLQTILEKQQVRDPQNAPNYQFLVQRCDRAY